jgi:parallel beta-helix repeat protein
LVSGDASAPVQRPAPGLPVPGDAVAISAGDNAKTIVEAHPPGTAFRISAGVHHGFSVRPKPHDSFFAEPDAILDGDNNAPYAFFAFTSRDDPGAHFITIQGASLDHRLVIRNYSAGHQDQVGAIHPQHGTETGLPMGDHWSLQWVEVTLTWATGIVAGPNMTIRQCYIHENGQLGIGGGGSGIVIDGNEIATNNSRRVRSEWEAGGVKLAKADGAVITNNYVHDNHGPGLWDDIDSGNLLYAGNTVVHNDREGIVHEIGHRAVIRDNVVTGNGFGKHGWLWGAGILVSTSSNTEIYGNTVTGNANGIAAVEQDREITSLGSHHLDNLSVHDNRISGPGLTGVDEDIGDKTVFQRRLAWDRNSYAGGVSFMWMNAVRSWPEWRGFGLDGNGRWSSLS